MLQQEKFLDDIINMDVFDTHTHLVGTRLAAVDFWNIAEYFWFLRELRSAGYPENAKELPENQRIEAFLKAFSATRNTTMNWIIRSIFKYLYGINIIDHASIKKADAAIRETSKNPKWAKTVCNKLSIKKIVVNNEKHSHFKNLPDTSVFIPRLNLKLNEWVEYIKSSLKKIEAEEKIAKEIRQLMKDLKEQGHNGVILALPHISKTTYNSNHRLRINETTYDDMIIFIMHCICKGAEENSMFIQLFLSMERGFLSQKIPVNDPYNIANLCGLFEKYSCMFELVIGSDGNNMAVVQAARLFPNVHTGGLWWMNFRVSTYLDCMQKRFEALPANNSSIIVSDARCIEWCYGKILLVKQLLADFLYEQIQQGWINREEALCTAHEWLYNSAAARYGINSI